MALPEMGWDTFDGIDTDLYVWFRDYELESVRFGTAYYRRGGTTRTYNLEVVWTGEGSRLLVKIPTADVPNGLAFDAWFELTLHNSSVVRIPAAGNFVWTKG